MNTYEQYREETKLVRKVAEGTFAETEVWNTPITQKENMIRFFKKDNPMFQPKYGDTLGFAPRIYLDNIARALVMDAEEQSTIEKGGPDIFGVNWEFIPSAGGSMVRPGKPKLEDINDWEKQIVFPDLSKLDWEKSAKINEQYLDPNLPSFMWCMNGLFERLVSFMEFENAVVALIDEDDKGATKALFERLTIFYEELFEYWAKYYHPTIIDFHDDWGSQRSSFFSVQTCEEMLVPYLKRIVAAAHNHGIIFDMHSCGKHENLTPCMIEAGVDMWVPQPMNDFDQMYRDFGNDIVLGTAIFSETGTEEEDYRLAAEFMEKYGVNKNVMPYAGYDPENPNRAGRRQVFENIYCMSREAYK